MSRQNASPTSTVPKTTALLGVIPMMSTSLDLGLYMRLRTTTPRRIFKKNPKLSHPTRPLTRTTRVRVSPAPASHVENAPKPSRGQMSASPRSTTMIRHPQNRPRHPPPPLSRPLPRRLLAQRPGRLISLTHQTTWRAFWRTTSGPSGRFSTGQRASLTTRPSRRRRHVAQTRRKASHSFH